MADRETRLEARQGHAADAIDQCAMAVRRHDRDRYVSALLAPAGGRAALLALYAFNLEIARVRETVSEPMLGQIRLQWWREALDGIYGGGPVRRHSVAEALAAAIDRHTLPRAAFDRMIDGREFDLTDRQPATMDALAAYAAATSGTLAALAATALGGHGLATQDAAREVGTAWALAGLLRAIPFHAAQRRCYLPRDLLSDEAALADLYEGRARPAVRTTIAAVAELALAQLASARAKSASVPRAVRPALALAGLIEPDLRRLAKAGNDPFALPRPSPVRRQARMMWIGARGRF